MCVRVRVCVCVYARMGACVRYVHVSVMCYLLVRAFFVENNL